MNHFLWFYYFSLRSREVRHRSQRTFRGPGRAGDSSAPGFADIATFFALCVWLVPLFLFLSLSANDNALPTSSNGGTSLNEQSFTCHIIDLTRHAVGPLYSPTSYLPTQPIANSRSSLFKSILSIFPRMGRRSDPTEGIIVTHTPTPSAPSTPYSSSFGQAVFSPAPQSSPRLSSHGDPLHPRSSEESPGRARLSLRPPPKRSFTGPSFRSSSRSSDEGAIGYNLSVHIPTRLEDSPPVRRRTAVE